MVAKAVSVIMVALSGVALGANLSWMVDDYMIFRQEDKKRTKTGHMLMLFTLCITGVILVWLVAHYATCHFIT